MTERTKPQRRGRVWECGISAKKTFFPFFPITHLAECGAVNNLRERFGAFCYSSLSKVVAEALIHENKEEEGSAHLLCQALLTAPITLRQVPWYYVALYILWSSPTRSSRVKVGRRSTVKSAPADRTLAAVNYWHNRFRANLASGDAAKSAGRL